MLTFVDNFLDRITMYRLVLYVLIGLLVVAVTLSIFGILNYSPIGIVYNSIPLVIICWITNVISSKFLKVQTNFESAYITALILALIISPPQAGEYITILPFLGLAAGTAMTSKYLINIWKKHIFNPAAFAVAVTAAVFGLAASWWVGTSAMAIFVLIGGLLVVRKLRQFDLAISFLLTAAAATFVLTYGGGQAILSVEKLFTQSAILFFAAIMLTEPLTMPPNRNGRILYGILIGTLAIPQAKIGSFPLTPELALLAGNLFAYIISPKGRHVFTLKEIRSAGSAAYDFVFHSDRPFAFRPGQYMEWTLGHRGSDSRGNRRYFTIASSPTEQDTILGVKFYDHPSTFKQTLAELKIGQQIVAGGLAGDFILPSDPKQKLVFIAGGIGITPYRSMIKYLMDKNETRDITLIYSNRTAEEVAYWELFDEAAKKIKLKTVYTVTDEISPKWKGYTGMINQEMILAEVPDYQERMFYISGSHGMVKAFKKILRDMGVPRSKIKTDFFPGLA